VRIAGVVDLLAGRAVHARGGCRSTYHPVQSVGGTAIGPGDAHALARAYVDRLNVSELYAADLDALSGGPTQDPIIAALAAIGVPLLLDAAVTSIDAARHALALGADRAVVALETLPNYDALADICSAAGHDRIAFSLDLRDGHPITSDALGAGDPPDVVAARARDAGVSTVIVLDLARVGRGNGLDLALVARVRETTSGLTLLAGGGVRGLDDLTHLADAGCDGALVATALLDGRLSAEDVSAVRRYASRSR
jgi:phosphoribosylformimino-5-aminoimidazole carboxamide ribotide isomerase